MFNNVTEYNNYRINLNCCISKKAIEVSRLLSIADDCALLESQKLFLLNAYNEILCKYSPRFINEECISNYKLSTFNFNIDPRDVLSDSSTVGIYYNNILQYSNVYSGTIYSAIEDLFNDNNIQYYVTDIAFNNKLYEVMLPCDTNILDARITKGSTIIFPTTLIEQGNCDNNLICNDIITEAVGCLSETSYKKIINNINSLCEFCNCNQ